MRASYRSGSCPLVRPSGTVLITTRCSSGRGYHSLHGKDMRLYRAPGEKLYLDGREIVVFSPNLSVRDFEVSFWKGYRFFSSWPELATYLDGKHGGPATVGVFPMAPLRIIA